MKLGLISDTHGYLDSQVSRHFQGVDHILHAGDIGPESLILSLEQIAPVTAVVGNTDSGLQRAETEVLRLGQFTFLLHHIVDPHHLTSSLRRRIEKEAPDVVLFGHTHQPLVQRIGKILFVNPGSAGKKRFDLPRTLALLDLGGSSLQPEIIHL